MHINGLCAGNGFDLLVMPLSPPISSIKVFSVNAASSIVTWLSRVKFIRIANLKSLVVCVPNACEAFSHV